MMPRPYSKHFKVSEKIAFGKYEGLTIKAIFHYDPLYIEWLISTGNFHFDIEEFEGLPNSIPYYYPEPFVYHHDVHRNHLVDALNFIADGGTIPERRHTFSESTIKWNEGNRNRKPE